MKAYKILLVDDDPFILACTGRDLANEGYEVITAENGEKAIALLSSSAFDLVISDLVMDSIDGMTVLKKAKALNPETLVIILTGYGDTRSAVDALRLNADDYLLKPCESEELHFRVKCCLEKLELGRKIKKAHQELEKRVKERTAKLCQINAKLKQEIEHRKRAESALRESEEKYRTILESIEEGYFEVDISGELTFFNNVMCKILGYSRDELEDMTNRGDAPPETARKMGRVVNEMYRTGKPAELMNYKVIRKDGTARILEISASPMREASHRLIGFRGVARDVTERMEAEEQIHILTQQLMRAQETERQRIARELHDRVAQELSALKIACETLFDQQPQVPGKLREGVSKISAMLQGSITAVRDLAYDLSPAGLDQLGLVRTVFQYCEEVAEKNDLSVDFFSAGMDDLRLDFDTEISLYRVIQEALNNIIKHADARHVSVRLIASFPNIILRIEDNGQGFDVKNRLLNAIYQKRMGLRSMEERIHLLEGKFKMESRPMEGTRILIEVPFKKETIPK